MAVRIKRYEEQFNRLDELLARIEVEMGPEAELETREFKRGGFLGYGGQRMVEVIATLRINGDALDRPRTYPARESAAAALMADEPAAAIWPDIAEQEAPLPAPQPAALPPAQPAPVIAVTRKKVDLRADEPVSTGMELGPTEEEVQPPPPAPAPPRPTAPIKANPPRAAAVQPAPAPVPQPKPALASAPLDTPVTAPSELSELRQSISELKDTVLLLLKSQQQALGDQPLSSAAQPAIAPAMITAPSLTAPSGVADPLALDPAASLDAAPRLVYERLLDWNIGPYGALELINTGLSQLPDPKPSVEVLLGAVAREICRNILLSGGIQLRSAPPGKVVALIGATGVGKTTTIAKLAAHFAFQEGKRVSLVSLDNYRIAAAEQLRTYSEIMGVDLDIVFSREEFDEVLTQRKHSDLVLVDTAGRSPLNAHMIQELRDVFSAHPPDEVHLVVSASTKGDDLRLILRNFETLSYDHVIVSKLDETLSLGAVYNITKHCQVPISYFTVGQSVPEDIRPASLGFVQHWIEQGRFK